MNNLHRRKLITQLVTFAVMSVFSFTQQLGFTSKVFAQYCVGGASYPIYSCIADRATGFFECATGGSTYKSCSGTAPCSNLYGDASCLGDTTGCSIAGAATYCSAYYPPSPPPISTPPPSGTPQPTPTTEPQPGYKCFPGAGCQPSYDLDASFSLAACDPNCDVTDPNAGLSSCDDLADTAADAVIYPGQTQSWITWAPPTDGSATQRLNSISPGLITKNYTSPGDLLTMSYIFQEPESRAYAYYVFDDDNKTWYFYQGPDKPAVIMTKDDNVLAEAKKMGYTQITDFSAGNANNAANTLKRVYRVDPDGDGNAWTINGVEESVTNHIPRKWDLIPYVNCASALMADDHKYFGTNENKNIEWVCSQRKLYSNFRDDGELVPPKSTGNYFGLEKDSEQVFDPKIINPYGRWPIMNAINGYSDYDDFAFAFLMQKGFTDYRAGSLRPGYVRMPVLQIPMKTLYYEKGHELYAYVQTAVNENSTFKPVEDERDSGACLVNSNQNAKVIEPVYDYQPPTCDLIFVKDQNNNTATELKPGQTYNLSVQGKLQSKIFPFDNRNFDAYPDEGSIINWDNNSLSSYTLATCGSGGLACSDIASSRVLKIASNNSSASVKTREIEAGENLSRQTLMIEFDAKADSAGNLGTLQIERTPFISTADNLTPKPIASDTQTLKYIGPQEGSTAALTTSWQHYVGWVTFPDTAENDSTRFKLVIRPRSGGGNTYFDNFQILGTRTPSAYFDLTKKDECTPKNPIVQASQSSTNPLLFTNSETFTVPSSLVPGETYSVNANLRSSGTFEYAGNPACSGETASNCSKDFTIKACNETTPAKPTFQSPPESGSIFSYLKGTTTSTVGKPQENAVTEMSLLVSGGNKRLPIQVGVNGTNTNSITYRIYKMDNAGNKITGLVTSNAIAATTIGQNTYNFDIVPSPDMTNQMYLEVVANNTESCQAAGGTKSSTILVGKIHFMDWSKGYIFEAKRDQIADAACNETYVLPNYPPEYEQPALDANVINASVNVVTTPDTPPATDTYTQFSGLPYTRYVFGNLNQNWFYLPYNPDNTITWKNRVERFELNLPPAVTEDSYICLTCNQKSPAEPNVCSFDAAAKGYSTANTFDQVNFYIVNGMFGKKAWWQGRGGLVFANGTINSPLPLFNGSPSSLCDLALYPDLCQPFIAAKRKGVSPNNSLADPSSGIPISNSTIDGSNGVSGYYSQNITASNTNLNIQRAAASTDFQTYEEFYKTFDPAKINQINSGDSISSKLASAALSSAIIYDDSDTQPVYIFHSLSGKSIDLGSSQIAVNGAKIVVFIDGDLTISNTSEVRRISVDKNSQSFLMFVTSGNINFSPNLGLSSFSVPDPLVEGVYLAYGRLSVKSNNKNSATPADKKFIGEGSFIGLQGVDLERKFDKPADPISNEDNAKSPIEQFNFRPDFVVNAPDVIRQPDLTWAEIN